MASVNEHERSLVDRFVASFEKLDDMCAFETDPVAQTLTADDSDPQYGFKKWRPMHVETSPEYLEPIYSKLPARFPRIFERLVLSYRWADVDLRLFTLLANPPGPDLSGWLAKTSFAILSPFLLQRGYIQFGQAADGRYDPVCFDISSRTKKRDYRVVQIDHEEILCNDRLKLVAELAPSFEQLALNVIAEAEKGRQT